MIQGPTKKSSVVMWLAIAVLASFSACGDALAETPKAKNVIVLIADGCAAEQFTLIRWIKGEPLAVDGIRTGLVKTYIADSVVADSAPAGSAFATGCRTNAKYISVAPNGKTISVVPSPPEDQQYRPMATVLEGARLLGKATGIVCTSRASHATPAAYMAHVVSRADEESIMEQAVYQNVDVVFGGGEEYLLPSSMEDGKRTDRENLLDVLEQRGYQVIRKQSELAGLRRGKVFGMFAASSMAAEVDRPALAPTEPTLEEMTQKAIELLSQDPDGFFLMVEGSQVDWACHANDPSQLVSDLLMYDKAVAAALEFAKKDGNTLVLAFSDHNTGGMSIGNTASNSMYNQMSVEALVEPLKKMKASAPAMWKMVGDDKTPARIKEVVRQGWGMEISDADAEQLAALTKGKAGNAHNAFGEVLCPKYTYIGWTTHGHCGGDVPLGAFGPGRPVGVFDGPEIGQITANALGFDLERLNQRLFVDAAQAFADAKVTVDKTDAANPVVKIDFNGKVAELPVNKNLLRIGDRTAELEGIAVYIAKTQKVYLPMQAVNLIRGQASAPAIAIQLQR
jgi:alkaline phosphatase